jgi:lipopolysaccharide export system permease protein
VNLLDRHIFKGVLGTTVASVCLFAFVLMAGNLIRELLGPLLSGQLPLLAFGRLVLLSIPYALTFALPASMLTGVLMTLGRLSSDNEITAMRAAGLSIPRIAVPVLVLASLGALLALRVNFESMPWAKLEYEKEFASAIKANPLSFIRPKTFIREFPGNVIYVGSRDGADVRDVWFWRLDSEKRVLQFVQAQSGRVDYDGASNEFILTLNRVYEEDHDRGNPDDFTKLRISSFGEIEPFRLSMARYFGTATVHQKLQWMTYGEQGCAGAGGRREAARHRRHEGHADDTGQNQPGARRFFIRAHRRPPGHQGVAAGDERESRAGRGPGPDLLLPDRRGGLA